MRTIGCISVARIERSEIWDKHAMRIPDVATLHPGYHYKVRLRVTGLAVVGLGVFGRPDTP
jgi:hypothetical protein